MRKIINIPRLIFVCLLSVAVIVCSVFFVIRLADRFGNSIKRECELYFLNSEETTLEPEIREFRYKDESELYIKIMEELIKGPDMSVLKPILNHHTRFLTIDMTDESNIVTNFSAEFLTGDVSRDMLSVYAVVKTLCSLDGIYSVKVNVEGGDIYTPEGGMVDYLTSDDINLVSDVNEGEIHEVTLYFTKPGSDKLFAQKRRVKITDQLPLAHHVVRELISGPQGDDMISCISEESSLIGVNIYDNKCYVNFRNNFISKNAGNKNHEKLAVYSIVNSLIELENIGRVQFLIEGKKIDKFGDIDMEGLFEKDASVIGDLE